MPLLRPTDDTDNQPLVRRLRSWWRGDTSRKQLDKTPWGEAQVPDCKPGTWDNLTLKAAQMIWGHALLGPCSPDELAAIANWLQPRRHTRVALLGAGLGGFGLSLSRICHCPVTGFEQAEILLRLCPDRNQGHLRSLDSITVKTEHSFDHVVIDGHGHRAGDIIPLLQPASALASLRGSIMIRAYCVASRNVREATHHRHWAASEPVSPFVPTRAELVRQITRLGFAIVEEADVADIHVAAIDASWSPAIELIRLLNRKTNQKALIPALVNEAERWRERAEMIRKGDLAVVDMLARRPAG